MFSKNIWILRVQLILYVPIAFSLAFIIALYYAVSEGCYAFFDSLKFAIKEMGFKRACKGTWSKFKGEE
ncbi:hypothetical protein JHT19_06155 [Vibrio parahaemolyticus]|uniref:Uncharacterized protein n=1 Tax=Vibrio parahaemolyticus TaxID=670 RepID=A0A8H9MWA6_VIBPH|nr:hypothetical protein JHT19_06155 [Vibrio parahaemolyticus]HAS6672753.1 hypothetical protein [Vibrio parahaemolyticus]HAS6674858.1 hypothetical protein [Vibrio parahaemolyticus]HAS6678606.1 hypothetical protein [Vibrio parahaemolyticus]HAS6680558.1 hypothetical protein [Vibrio parahaemolyticus]